MYIFEIFHSKNKKPPVTKEFGYFREQISTVQRDDGHTRRLVLIFLGKAIFAASILSLYPTPDILMDIFMHFIHILDTNH